MTLNLVYTGTSLLQSEAASIFGSEWSIRPPIKRGDLQLLLSESNKPGIICILDGIFYHTGSVSIIEIRDAIQSGWKVVGACSMGALRAVEAQPLGMQGIGKVFQWLRHFKVSRDDEIAQVVDPESGFAFTHSLIDLRAWARGLRHQKELSREDANFFIDSVASIQFSERPLGKIRDFLPQNVKSKLNDELLRHYSWKRNDALFTANILRNKLLSIENYSNNTKSDELIKRISC